MSAIAQNFVAASNYAIGKVDVTKQDYIVYYRIELGEYIVTTPDSEIPSNACYYGMFYWNGVRVVWLYGKNEFT